MQAGCRHRATSIAPLALGPTATKSKRTYAAALDLSDPTVVPRAAGRVLELPDMVAADAARAAARRVAWVWGCAMGGMMRGLCSLVDLL